TSMKVEIEFGFGEIRVERGNPAKAVTGYLQYDEDTIRPSAKYRVDGNQAHFRLVTRSRRDGWHLDTGMDSPEGELYFTTKIPLDIDFSCGLGEATLDFGDMQVRELSLDNGLGATTLDFSKPNQTRLRRLSVDNGLGELTAMNLSNARTDILSFDSGLGSTTLDFRGAELHDMRVDVSVGLGSVTLKIPRGYNVEMDAEENFLATINTRGLDSFGHGRYRSFDWDSDRPTLRITAEVGLGSIDLRWVE
ncbi:MAG: toast rack family protein, partial [Candidatus Neomarinimicrobiota bacterium]